MDVLEKVKAVNKRLLDGEPGNISVDAYSGYTGYKPQSVVDSLNCELGIGQWGFSELSSQVFDGEKGQIVVTHLEVWLSGVDFKPSAYGQGRVTKGDIGDAFKSAQSDALKKALSYFSVGARAYHGLLQKGGASGK